MNLDQPGRRRTTDSAEPRLPLTKGSGSSNPGKRGRKFRPGARSARQPQWRLSRGVLGRRRGCQRGGGGGSPRLGREQSPRAATPVRPAGRRALLGALQPAAAGPGPRRSRTPAGLVCRRRAPRRGRKGRARAGRGGRGEGRAGGEPRLSGRPRGWRASGGRAALAQARRAAAAPLRGPEPGPQVRKPGSGAPAPDRAGRARSSCPLRPARARFHWRKKADNRQTQPWRRRRQPLPRRGSEPIPSSRGGLCVCECAALSPHAWHMRKSELRPKSQPYPP